MTDEQVVFSIKRMTFAELAERLAAYERKHKRSTVDMVSAYAQGTLVPRGCHLDDYPDLEDWFSLFLLWLGMDDLCEYVAR